MRRDVIKWLLLTTAVLLPLTACEDDTTSPGDNNGNASLSVYITDAPGDVEAVWVEIVGVSLQGESGPVDLLAEPTELIPLTDLVGTAQLLVADASLEPATYRQLRLVVGDAVLVSSDGTIYVKGDPVLPEGLEGPATGELQCPSCSQSGLKVTLPNDELVLGEETAGLVIDFDVTESFGHKAGNSGKWVMHPVMRGTVVEDADGDGDTSDDVGAVSSILGTVALGSEVTIPECPAGTPRSITDFVPTATAQTLVDGESQPIVLIGSVAAEGTFQINFVAADTYSLGYTPSLDLGDFALVFTATVEPTEAVVGDQNVTGVAYTIQSATCQATG